MTGPTTTWLAKAILIREHVATVLVRWGPEAKNWKCVRHPSNDADTGIEFNLGPLAWWEHVTVEALDLVLDCWRGAGVFVVGPRVGGP